MLTHRFPYGMGFGCSMFFLVLVAQWGCSPATLDSVAERQRVLEALESQLSGNAATSANASPTEETTKETAESTGAATADQGALADDVSAVPQQLLASSRRTNAPLATRIDAALERERTQRLLSSTTNAAWQIMHGVISYGGELPLETPDRGVVGALDYAFHGGLINGFELGLGSTPLPSTQRTGVTARLEPGSYVGQGHPDQWLAIFAMANVPLETEVMVGDTRRTLLDWGRQAQADVVNNLLNEYSWTLIALTHYFPSESQWATADGTTVSWEALVEAELTNDINTSACGGTHRLSGIVRALAAHKQLGLPDSPIWQEARQVVDRAIDNARVNRSRDGSLSSSYFVKPSRSADVGAELSSAGHIFEFLALALPREELAEPWIELAGHRLCDLLDATQGVELDCGALYHALNGLKLYRQRRSID
jgi:hypothetical protein